MQALGGGLAAQGRTRPALLQAGNRAIIAGIALQVVVLLAFGALSAEYLVRASRWVKTAPGGGPGGTAAAASGEARALWGDGRFRVFLGAMTGAYACVQIRCIYR